MAKRSRPSPGKCVHCLSNDVARTWDHVFPKSWYPETTPPNLYKWQIPSCLTCNQEYGVLEADLLLRFGMCIDPQLPAAAGILEKIRKFYKPEFAKDERDGRARAALKKKLLKELIPGSEIRKDAVYPGMGERWRRSDDEAAGIRISADNIHRLTEKIVRGIYFIEDGKFVELPYVIEFHALTENGAAGFKELLDRFGSKYDRGPGIVVRRAVTPDDNMSSVFEIVIWDQVKMYASVRQPH